MAQEAAAQGVGGAGAPAGARGAGSLPGAALGRRQAGVAEAAAPCLSLLAYDFAGADGRALAGVLDRWGAVLARPSGVTVTLGLGPAAGRLLPGAVPVAFGQLPPLPGDRLAPERGGGDLLLQLTGGTPERLAAVAAGLAAAAEGVLVRRWAQHGRTAPAPPGETPRNLFGFKDGTANPGPGEGAWIWLPDGPHAGGTYLVYRRIAMDTAAFGALTPAEQEAVIGRRRADGSPLGGTREHEDPDLYAKTPEGRYLIPATAHVRLTNPRLDGGARMLRRGYTYTDGPGDQGLLFCAYLLDPALFVRVQQRLAARDALGRFVEHRASAVFYLPPRGTPLGPRW
ncbi:hypothetical protein CFP65_5887 [Kitasatospora sp. MMS16-BH015]|uniref:Dyp-type peroxidase n=1 Tax=Kitasatospora sp. MMS16-BH015 TaxID=2018025 RepID=UPI000CA17A06|nr:Dyp-type peroxidase [Kitasatospora sp. MMS16-BH015]AUG80567.1 hypothetical protein CFP65_5887 [Kitasatospora sp. MMS16-BH015]